MLLLTRLSVRRANVEVQDLEEQWTMQGMGDESPSSEEV